MRSSSLKIVFISFVVFGLMAGIVAYGRNVSSARHPNLAAAQTLIERAREKITMAQKANEFDLAGHAAKAKALIDDAYAEIKLAALTSNANK